MSYFAAALVRADEWSGEEISLDDIDDLDELVDRLRDVAANRSAETALLLLEENDEYLAVVRVDGDADPRVFLSDARLAETSDLAALVYEGVGAPPPQVAAEPAEDATDDGPSLPPEGDPAGDDTVFADMGTPAAQLLELCAEEGMLPGDVFAALAERAGFAEVLEELR